MSRSSFGAIALVATAAFAGLSSSARAICAIPIAGYSSGLFGAEAVTASGCFPQPTAGGPGFVAAAIPLTGTMSASANLSTGVLTAYSAGGIASAAEWDTFTFAGLPPAGEAISATLSLSGSLSGNAFGTAIIQAGPSAGFGGVGTVQQTASFGDGNPIPSSIGVDFTVTDASSLTVGAQILAVGGGGNIADLTDPPTLTLDLPPGVTATPASGVFANFGTAAAVPEPAGSGVLLAGFGFLLRARRKRQRLV